MKPEDFGLTLKDPARPERGWTALGQTLERVRARPSSGLDPGCARATRTDRGARASRSTGTIGQGALEREVAELSRQVRELPEHRDRRAHCPPRRYLDEKRLDEARSVLTVKAIGKSRLVLSRPKTINSQEEP
jgi:hypothetical protein